MKTMMIRLAAWSFALGLCLPAGAQIRIGQTAGFTGPAAASVKEMTDGALLYLDFVNARGGVNSEAIELVSMDDKFDPKLAGENAKKLIVDNNVVALFLTRGTPHTQAVLPLLAEYRVPLIAPSTGAMVLHKPVNPWVYNVRATYQRESARAVQHLSLIGLERIGVLHVEDSFGADLLEGAQKGFVSIGKTPAFVETYSREKWDFRKVAELATRDQVQAILVVGSATATVDAITALRSAGSRAQVIAFSNNASGGFVKLLKDNAEGTIVTQVFPSERSMTTPLVREANELALGKGMEGLSPAMLEGYAAAKVLVAALRRAGPLPTRLKVQQALDGMSRFDLGGLEVSYSPTDHTGLDFVELSIIGREGKFRR